MAEISKRNMQLNWIFRILITLDVFVIISGYTGFLQTQQQLVSPLIPRYTVYQIMDETLARSARVGILSACICVVSCWLFSFNKKLAATVLLLAPPILYLLW